MRVEFTRYQRTKFTALTVFAGLDRVRPADKNTVKNLRRYDEQHFNRLSSLLVNFCANNHVEKIFVGHPSSVSPLLLYSPDEVVLAAFKCCLNITVLDLRNLSEGVARVKQVMASLPQQYSPTLVQVTDLSPVLGLLTLIQEQSSALKVIEQNSSSCVDDVFVAINLAGEQLGFLNMTATRQIDDDEWLRLCRIHGDRSAVRPFSLDEAGPTIKSIFDSPNIFFDVDIADLVKGINEYFGKSVEEFVADLMVKNNIDDLSELSVDYSQWGIEVSPLLTLPSFEAAGIIPNLKSLLIELIETKGPTRYLFVKMVSAYGVEAVVHLHNRVKKNSSVDPKPVFSESEDVTRGIKKALEVYFTGAVRAIERIRSRQIISPVQMPAVAVATQTSWPEKYLKTGSISRIDGHNAQGEKVSVSLELVRFPYSYLMNSLDLVVNDLFQVFSDAFEPLLGHGLDPVFFKPYIRDHYLRSAEKLAVLRNEQNKVVGFAVLTKEIVKDRTIFCLSGTMMHPSIQGMRLSIKINQLLLIEAWQENKHANHGRIQVLTRTASYRVVGSVLSFNNLFPHPYHPNKKPKQEVADIMSVISERWTPQCEFDPGIGVCKGALKAGVGGLSYPEDSAQLHRDPRVNRFLNNILDFKNGDLLMLYGEISRRTIFKQLIKNFSRAIGEWLRRSGLKLIRKWSFHTFS